MRARTTGTSTINPWISSNPSSAAQARQSQSRAVPPQWLPVLLASHESSVMTYTVNSNGIRVGTCRTSEICSCTRSAASDFCSCGSPLGTSYELRGCCNSGCGRCDISLLDCPSPSPPPPPPSPAPPPLQVHFTQWGWCQVGAWWRLCWVPRCSRPCTRNLRWPYNTICGPWVPPYHYG